jgi:glycosyltransferase involved in cell wall biosynthesis
MAMFKPVVGSKIGGTIEQIDDCETGFLVEPNNPEHLAIALEKLLINPELRDLMGRAGRKKYEEEFEFIPYYNKILNLYNQNSYNDYIVIKK